MSAKITWSEAEQKVKENWPYLSIVEDSFESVRKPCLVIDSLYGTFTVCVKNLLSRRALPGHPDRFKEHRQKNAKLGGDAAYRVRADMAGISTEELKHRSKMKKQERKKQRNRVASEERRRFYRDNYGVEWKGATPENRAAASERAKAQNTIGKCRAVMEERYGVRSWSQSPCSLLDRVEYLVDDQPYFVFSDPVGWNRDAARSYLKNYGDEAFVAACAGYRGARNLLEKHCLERFPVSDWNKKILNYRPDFYIQDRLFMNADGLFWHNEENKGRWYHYEMRERFEKARMQILQIRQDEIYGKEEIVASMIRSRTGMCRKIGARKCVAKDVSAKDAHGFQEKNHLMGGRLIKGVGLFFGDELVCLITIKKTGSTLKIERFCSKLDTIVVGGLSRLLKEVVKIHGPDVVESWVDLRYGNGKSLEELGFVAVKETLGWKWANRQQTFNRLKCRANMDERKLSQKEHAEELGWFKIYDAGQRLYRYEI